MTGGDCGQPNGRPCRLSAWLHRRPRREPHDKALACKKIDRMGVIALPDSLNGIVIARTVERAEFAHRPVWLEEADCVDRHQRRLLNIFGMIGAKVVVSY